MSELQLTTSSTLAPVRFKRLTASATLREVCQQPYHRLVVVSDETVAALYGQALLAELQQLHPSVHLLTIPPGEASKSRQMKQRLEDELLSLSCGRDTCLIALGGGVVTDLVGFVAATFCRGIPVIYFPTSLLAMVDAAIGGKTGINTPQGKNLLGTFTQPQAVVIDPTVLSSLSEVDYLTGFAEIIKHGVIADSAYVDTLKRNSELLKQRDLTALQPVIERSIAIKSNIVANDVLESHQRVILNAGHTIGHALEVVSAYQLSHGEAVAIGLAVEGFIAVEMGYLAQSDWQQLIALLQTYGFQLKLPTVPNPAQLLASLLTDKKRRQGDVQMVLLKCLGEVVRDTDYTVTVPQAVLNAGFAYLIDQCQQTVSLG